MKHDIFVTINQHIKARSSIGFMAVCYKPEGRASRSYELNDFFFLIYLILPVALVPGIYSASNRNGYQKQKNHVSGL
jgi:hypothetical protein